MRAGSQGRVRRAGPAAHRGVGAARGVRAVVPAQGLHELRSPRCGEGVPEKGGRRQRLRGDPAAGAPGLRLAGPWLEEVQALSRSGGDPREQCRGGAGPGRWLVSRVSTLVRWRNNPHAPRAASARVSSNQELSVAAECRAFAFISMVGGFCAFSSKVDRKTLLSRTVLYLELGKTYTYVHFCCFVSA